MKKHTVASQRIKRPGLGLGLGLGLNNDALHKKPKISVTVFDDANANKNQAKDTNEKENDDVDPFEEFMKKVDEQATLDSENIGKTEQVENIYEQVDAEDNMDQYYASIEEKATEALVKKFVQQHDVDSDQEVYEAARRADIELQGENQSEDPHNSAKRKITPLPEIDHSKIQYPDIKKIFYKIHPEIEALEESVVEQLTKKFGIKVSGGKKISPCISFAHFGLPSKMVDVIAKQKYTEPTAIQKQAIPVALSGEDIIGIAKTGSGKTGAFIWPMIIHILGQTKMNGSSSPRGIVLAPTRELVVQIFNESRKYTKATSLEVVALYGGVSKHEQLREILKKTPDIIVSTPGRLIDIVSDDGIDLKRVSFLVLDEADRMLNLGFEMQVRSICDSIRPDRQSLLFSATFPKNIEKLAKSTTKNPIKIVIGQPGEINDDITQEFILFDEESEKWSWLISHIVKYTMDGNVLIFVLHKSSSELLANQLQKTGITCLSLHGDMLQSQRDSVLFQFKNNKIKVLVATDVASRGLDIKYIKTVINYESSRDFDSHVHRVGRTGRAGEKGTAITLLQNKNPEDISFVSKYLKSLQRTNERADIPSGLVEFSRKNGINIFNREKVKFRNNPLSNPGLSHMIRGSRLPGDRSGLGQR